MAQKTLRDILIRIVFEKHNDQGRLVVLQPGRKPFESLKSELNLDDNQLGTLVGELEQSGYIQKAINQRDTNAPKYTILPAGYDFARPRWKKESNYKWYINLAFVLLGAVFVEGLRLLFPHFSHFGP